MKVYFNSMVFDGCWYARIYLPMQYGGWDGDKISLLSPRVAPERASQGSMHADIVVFQRPDDIRKLEAARLLKQAGKKIVFENDDSYKHFDQPLERMRAFKQVNHALDSFIAEADLVTASTEFLADEYRLLNPNVVVLPNCVDPSDWPIPKRNTGDKFRIGFVGSIVTSPDAFHIRSVLKTLSKNPNVQLVVFGIPPKSQPLAHQVYEKEFVFWNKLNIEWHPSVSMDKYINELNDLELDLMLIPRANNYFNRAKSNIKFLEASMLEIPVIAQGFNDGLSPYQQNGDDEHMYIVTGGPSEWLADIEDAMSNKVLLRKMAKDAHDYVIKKYNIHMHIKKWEEAYKKLLE